MYALSAFYAPNGRGGSRGNLSVSEYAAAARAHSAQNRHILSRAACSAASLKYRGARYAEGTGKAVYLRFADVLSDQMEKTDGKTET